MFYCRTCQAIYLDKFCTLTNHKCGVFLISEKSVDMKIILNLFKTDKVLFLNDLNSSELLFIKRLKDNQINVFKTSLLNTLNKVLGKVK